VNFIFFCVYCSFSYHQTIWVLFNINFNCILISHEENFLSIVNLNHSISKNNRRIHIEKKRSLLQWIRVILFDEKIFKRFLNFSLCFIFILLPTSNSSSLLKQWRELFQETVESERRRLKLKIKLSITRRRRIRSL
jgi:hypothetical protein